MLIDLWWEDFLTENPSADAVYQLLSAQEGIICHDHIALRTFDLQRVCIDTVMTPLVSAGYTCKGEYAFPETHVYARHYEHNDETVPTIFISQLELESFSAEFQTQVECLLGQIPEALSGQWELFSAIRPWKVSYAAYEAMKKESEYAAWVSVFGFRPTHFAVQTNRFTHYRELTRLNTFLKERGFELNSAGGEIQGNPEVFLEQSSIKATQSAIQFPDGTYPVSGTFYEFANRYVMGDGMLFNGFLMGSAQNLFHSTHSS